MTLVLSMEAKASWNLKNALDLSTPADQGQLRKTLTFADGSGNNQANKIWHDRRSIAAAGNDDIDLSGSLVNSLGLATAFTAIKGIQIVNRGVNVSGTHTPTEGEDLALDSSVANSILGPFAGSNTSKISIPSGGVEMKTDPLAGWPVTAGTADILRISNVGTAEIFYDIVIWGV